MVVNLITSNNKIFTALLLQQSAEMLELQKLIIIDNVESNLRIRILDKNKALLQLVELS